MRSRRAGKRFNQTRVGEACEKSQVWVSLVERGLLTPNPSDARRIGQILGAPAKALFPEIANKE